MSFPPLSLGLTAAGARTPLSSPGLESAAAAAAAGRRTGRAVRQAAREPWRTFYAFASAGESVEGKQTRGRLSQSPWRTLTDA